MAKSSRSSYHHGDLKAALAEQAWLLAREHGPAKVSLREVTRAAGVSVNAAYRHFADRDALMFTVTTRAQGECARTMEALGATDAGSGVERLRAVGLGYIAFARKDPGLFEAAFSEPVNLDHSAHPYAAGDSGMTPFTLLGAALDQMVAEGSLAESARPGAEVCAWSAVHGFAWLVVRGPFRQVPDEVLDALAARTVQMAIEGLRSEG